MTTKPTDWLPFTTPEQVRSEAAGISLDIGETGFARITFDSPLEKVNTLTTATMERLDALLSEVRGEASVRGLIFRSGKPSMFIAGADIAEIEGVTNAAEGEGKARRGQQIFQRIADLAFPTVAAIGGPCLGGGCELALACDFRVASDSPKTMIGLPEVRLGILPGFGGTQRLPALIGLPAALDIILAGKTIDAKRAARLGLVDRIVPAPLLEIQAQRILEVAIAHVPRARTPDGRRRDWRKTMGLRTKVTLSARMFDATSAGRAFVGWGARARLQKTVDEKHYPAPYLALKSTVEGRSLGLARGLDNEARLLGELIVTTASKNLIFLFKATTAAKSDPGVSGPVPPLHPITKVGVIGSGQMGAGIAAACAKANVLVRMRDVSWDTVTKGVAAASKLVQNELDRGKIDARAAARRRSALSGTIAWTGFRNAGLVVEAVLERLEVKREVFSRLETLVDENAILASNTSSLPIAEIAAGAKHPERFIGMHFFNPVDRMPLVEVVVHRGTDTAVTATTVDFAKKLGKTPVVVKDSPGFLVNRILMPYLGEALMMFEEGTRIEGTDAQVRAFGMPMGPFELLDTIGLDVAHHVSKVLLAAFGDRLASPGALEKLTVAGQLGKKTGAGFYTYDRGRRRRPSKQAAKVVGVQRAKRAAPETGRPAGRLTGVQERLVLPMINEAAMALGEGIVRSPVDVDLAMILGTGFPPFRGGLLRFADSVGAPNLVDRLEILAERYGKRFVPADYLKDLAQKGRNFHSTPYSS